MVLNKNLLTRVNPFFLTNSLVVLGAALREKSIFPIAQDEPSTTPHSVFPSPFRQLRTNQVPPLTPFFPLRFSHWGVGPAPGAPSVPDHLLSPHLKLGVGSPIHNEKGGAGRDEEWARFPWCIYFTTQHLYFPVPPRSLVIVTCIVMSFSRSHTLRL